jgi:hypothetical protein
MIIFQLFTSFYSCCIVHLAVLTIGWSVPCSRVAACGQLCRFGDIERSPAGARPVCLREKRTEGAPHSARRHRLARITFHLGRIAVADRPGENVGHGQDAGIGCVQWTCAEYGPTNGSTEPLLPRRPERQMLSSRDSRKPQNRA